MKLSRSISNSLCIISICCTFGVAGCGGGGDNEPLEAPNTADSNRAFPGIKAPVDVVTVQVPEEDEPAARQRTALTHLPTEPEESAFDKLTVADLTFKERVLLSKDPKAGADRVGRRIESIANQISMHFENVRDQRTAMQAKGALERLLPTVERLKLLTENFDSDESQVEESLTQSYRKLEESAQTVLDSEFEPILGEIVKKLKDF